jgi:hypothetical protein
MADYSVEKPKWEEEVWLSFLTSNVSLWVSWSFLSFSRKQSALLSAFLPQRP